MSMTNTCQRIISDLPCSVVIKLNSACANSRYPRDLYLSFRDVAPNLSLQVIKL